MKVLPPLELKVFVVDFTAFMEGQNTEGSEVDEKRGRRDGSEAVDHGRREGREEQGDCVVPPI